MFNVIWNSSRLVVMRDSGKPLAIVTGILGQDGAYLHRHLERLGYRVLGTSRKRSCQTTGLGAKVPIVTLDYDKISELRELLRAEQPSILFHLASIANSAFTGRYPRAHRKINVDFLRSVFDLISTGDVPPLSVIHASSSEIFSGHSRGKFTEQSSSRPTNPYGEAKSLARELVLGAQTSGIPAKTAIMFSHESPIRRPNFLSRKVTQHVAKVVRGETKPLVIRGFNNRRDWGHADDYSKALAIMPKGLSAEYVIASGQSRSVRDLCKVAFESVGLNYEKFVVESPHEIKDSTRIDLVGDSRLISSELGWSPTHSFEGMIGEMVRYDLSLLDRNGV